MIHILNDATESECAVLKRSVEWVQEHIGPIVRHKFGTFQGEYWLIMATSHDIKVYIDDPALEVMFKLACL